MKESGRRGERARPKSTFVSLEACAIVVDHAVVLLYRKLDIWYMRQIYMSRNIFLKWIVRMLPQRTVKFKRGQDADSE